MELADARVLIAGGSGEVGRALASELRSRGATVAVAGRDAERLFGAAEGGPTATFDLLEPASIRPAVDDAVSALGGLDLLVVATGTVAFGPVGSLSANAADELLAVNVRGPQLLIAAALPHLEADGGGAIAVMSAIVADFPTAGMAAYSASKAALSAYLEAARRELRRDGVTVLDVRPPHLDTGFSSRTIEGEAPELPDPFAVTELAGVICDALADDKRSIAWDLTDRHLVVS